MYPAFPTPDTKMQNDFILLQTTKGETTLEGQPLPHPDFMRPLTAKEFRTATGIVAATMRVADDFETIAAESTTLVANTIAPIPRQERRLVGFSWNRPWFVKIVVRKNASDAVVLARFADTDRWLPAVMPITYIREHYQEDTDV